jgi:hypothetical protein
MTTKTASKAATKTTANATTPKPAAKKPAAKKPRDLVTGGTFDASKVETHKCAGACGQRLPVKKFPTITGTTRRVAECRSCRDARTKAAKGAKA